jgi:hypothetical protein
VSVSIQPTASWSSPSRPRPPPHPGWSSRTPPRRSRRRARSRRRPRADDDKGVRVAIDIKVGDRVIYSKYGGTEIKHGGQEFLLLSARDVLAIVG